MSISPLGFTESLCIGTVESVSPDEIRVLLTIDAPNSVALNTGTPRPFPRVNNYVLIPSDQGYVVGQVEWLTIERSAYPKRIGMQDFGLVDLPYPSRKMSLNPLGILFKSRETEGKAHYRFRRGINAFPSVGDSVLLPTQQQLRSIVESGDKRRVKIGTSPLAGNSNVYVDPDRLFGRHLAILGNTGSGKSCSVAGIIRWSLEAAAKHAERPNARFIVLDPNGEYIRAFGRDTDGLKPRVFTVEPDKESETLLQVPLWFWNTAEWTAFTHATEKTHRPILQQALRLRRNVIYAGEADATAEQALLVYLQGAFSTISQQIAVNAPFKSIRDADYWRFIEILEGLRASLVTFMEKSDDIAALVKPIADYLDDLITVKCKNKRDYNVPFVYGDIDGLKDVILSTIQSMGGNMRPDIPIHEDTPIPFSGDDLLSDLSFLATNSGNRQWFDFFIARIQTLLTDAHVKSIVDETTDVTLQQWLADYVGSNHAENGNLTIIDLSLVSSNIIYIIASVIARMVFEALQRYRKLHKEHKVLPTVLVMEEAHTFVKRYKEDTENQNAASVCCQVFERIAREGRKFGLGLVLSSQRPSELSPTVLSQCNTFLLHRLSNDKDQDLVHRFVPDSLKGLLRELPTLPSQYAILLGWASELPILVRMNALPENQRPQSDDPDFWDVWNGEAARDLDWEPIVNHWQGKAGGNETLNESCDDVSAEEGYF